MASVPREGAPAQDFQREVIDINLRRIPWLLVASMLLALWPIASLWHDDSWAWLRLVLIVDLMSAGMFLAFNFKVRGLRPESLWRSLYVWTAVFLALAYMDGYYFLGEQTFGQNPVYILGVITAATVFLLPPQKFLPLLLVNHLIYCVLLEARAGAGANLLPVFIENTTGATMAGLVSVLLYRARREEYFQRRALAAANRVLAKRNDQLNDLMAITAHDLRGPLLGMRDLLALAGRTPSAGRLGEMLARVGRSCSDLISLVNRLLDAHAAEEQAEKSMALEVRDVRELVAAAVERARLRADVRGIVVNLEFPDHPVRLQVNAPALGQILDNLLSNAIKFSPSSASVPVRLICEDERWRCDVADNGPGIPAEERATLFQKFHRGTNVPATGEASSGLGLFIAATLMQAMGGQVHYLPVEPRGSLFRITFGQHAPASASS